MINKSALLQVISELLDIKATPSKPAYGLATASPLCLFDCSYNAEFKWQWNISALRAVRGNLLKKWAEMQALLASRIYFLNY